MLTLIASAAMLSSVTPLHQGDVTHGANSYQTTYETAATVTMQQVEPRFATRAAIPVCRWQAELVVNRSVAKGSGKVAALSKPIHRIAPLSGSHAGSCTAARSQIEAQVSRHEQAASVSALTAARQDRSVLAAELDGLRAL